MALVSYENSDSDDFEENENEILSTKTSINQVSELMKSDVKKDSEKSHSLFNLLPQPSSKKPTVIEDDDEFLRKKETVPNLPKPKAKITVPLLSDFKDVEESVPNKPRTASLKKSGLLSMLPQPKNTVSSTATSKSFIPHVLTKKPTTTTVKKKTPMPSPAGLAKAECSKSLAIDHSDDSDDDVHNDFFSMNKPVELPTDDFSLDIDSKTTLPNSHKEPPSIESYFKKDVENPLEMQTDDNVYYNDESSNHKNPEYENGYTEGSSNEVILDEEAIRKLSGTRGKRKREEIQIVDVNQQEVLADAREWLMKGLMDDTTKRVSSSKKKGNEPTHQQKRKHQITYLAHQAKANEAELQNQWANNRMTKRQTQSKYGF